MDVPQDAAYMLVNPVYAISISGDLAGGHDPLVTKSQWVAANMRLMEEIGAKAWLETLLAVLEGDFPRNPDEAR